MHLTLNGYCFRRVLYRDVFTSMYQEFCPWGEGGINLPHCMLEYTHPWTDRQTDRPPGQTPYGKKHTSPWTDTPLDRHITQADTPLDRHTQPGETPLRADTPPSRHPLDSHCSGRYASYWNAFFFKVYFGLTK